MNGPLPPVIASERSAAGPGIRVGVSVGVAVGVCVGVPVRVGVAVSIGLSVGVSVDVPVAAGVALCVGVSVAVWVGVRDDPPEPSPEQPLTATRAATPARPKSRTHNLRRSFIVHCSRSRLLRAFV